MCCSVLQCDAVCCREHAKEEHGRATQQDQKEKDEEIQQQKKKKREKDRENEREGEGERMTG